MTKIYSSTPKPTWLRDTPCSLEAPEPHTRKLSAGAPPTWVKPSLMRLCLKVLANCSSSSRSLGSSRLGVSMRFGVVWLCGSVWIGVAAIVRVGVAGCCEGQNDGQARDIYVHNCDMLQPNTWRQQSYLWRVRVTSPARARAQGNHSEGQASRSGEGLTTQGRAGRCEHMFLLSFHKRLFKEWISWTAMQIGKTAGRISDLFHLQMWHSFVKLSDY